MAVYPWELSIEDGVMSAWLNGTLNIGEDLIVSNDLTVGNDLDVAGIVQGDLLNNYVVQKAGFDVLGLMTDPRFLNLMCDDPGAGTMIDISGQGHDGTYQGTMTTSDRLKKNMGWVIDFDGANDYIEISDHNDFSFGDGSNDEAVTWFGVIEVVSAAGNRRIMSKRDDTTATPLREWALTINSTERLGIIFFDNSAGVSCSRDTNVALSDGYHSYAITYDGAGGATAANTISIYVDGALVASTAYNDAGYVAMENLTTDVLIGAYTDSSSNPAQFYDGNIACNGLDGSKWSAFDAHRFHQLMKGLYGL